MVQITNAWHILLNYDLKHSVNVIIDWILSQDFNWYDDTSWDLHALKRIQSFQCSSLLSTGFCSLKIIQNSEIVA